MTSTPQLYADEVSLEAKLAFLRQPSHHPGLFHRIEAIETHMSWVFLTERFAYKLKKPVRYELLDFRTIETRQYFCEEEVRLNRRLAGDVYIGTVRLVLDAHGHLQLGGEGKAADWLVKMRRLPADRMLDHEIKSGMANQEIMRLNTKQQGSFLDEYEANKNEQAAHNEHQQQEID